MSKSKFVVLAIIGIFAGSTLVMGIAGLGFTAISSSAASAASCPTYPCTSSLTVISYNGNDQSAISDLTGGKISAYDFQLTPVETNGLPSNFGQIQSPNSLYEVLVNPENTTWSGVSSVSGVSAFNPMYYPQIRLAFNYVLNRQYFVNTLLGGAGVPTLSVYGVNPDALTVANATVPYLNYVNYNFQLANSTIRTAMSSIAGVTVANGKYYFQGALVPVYIVDRTDDPIRSQYAGYLATQLDNLGFDAIEEAMNLAIVRTTVFTENPVNGTGGTPATPWDIYPGSYGNVILYYGDQLQVCFDGAACGGTGYSDNMGGLAWGIWNTTAQTPPDVVALSDKIDVLNNQILAGTYTNLAQRAVVLSNYTALEIQMGVSDWIAAGLNVYGYNPAQISGLQPVITTTPILNLQSYLLAQKGSTSSVGCSTQLCLGARYLTQYNMNPVGGYGDAYSADLLSGVFPTVSENGPGTGYSLPYGWTYSINAINSSASLPVPTSAINYNGTTGRWSNVTSGSTAALDFVANFAPMLNAGFADNETWNIGDILYPYATGVNVSTAGNKIYDSSLAPLYKAELANIVGFKLLNSTSMEVYSKYFFFDPVQAVIQSMSYFYSGAPRDYAMPWTTYVAMSDQVAKGADAWSEPTAAAKSIPWLTLIGSGPQGSPTDVSNLKADLMTRATQAYVPTAISQLETLTGVTFMSSSSVGSQYTDAANFITSYGNVLIGNGPYFISNFQAATTPNYAIMTPNPQYKIFSQLDPRLFAPAARISVSATIPATLASGSSVALTTLSAPLTSKTASPQSGVNVTIQLIGSSGIANQVKLVSGAGGTATYKVPAVAPGAYTLEIYANSANSSIIVPQTYSTTILGIVTSTTSSGPPISTTSTVTTSGTGVATTTTTTATTTTTNNTNLEIIAAIVVVIIIIAAVVLFVRRRPAAPATST